MRGAVQSCAPQGVQSGVQKWSFVRVTRGVTSSSLLCDSQYSRSARSRILTLRLCEAYGTRVGDRVPLGDGSCRGLLWLHAQGGTTRDRMESMAS